MVKLSPRALFLALTLPLLPSAAPAGTPPGSPVPRADASPDTIVFEFAPPDSLDFEQTVVTVKLKRSTGGWRQEDRSEITTAASLRAEEGGYSLTLTPVAMVATRDGKPLLEPMQALFQDVVMTYVLDFDGGLEAIDGLAGLAEKARRLLPPGTARALEPVLSEDALFNRELSEWNGRITDFVGATVVIGDSVTSEVPFTLPNGQTLTYYMRLYITGWRDTPLGPRLQIDTVFDSDARSVDTFLSGMADRVLAAAGADSLALEVAGTRVSGASRRLIDPATMLIYEETATRTMSFTMKQPGAGAIPLVLREERRYTYRY